jgi:hypothetical protein
MIQARGEAMGVLSNNGCRGTAAVAGLLFALLTFYVETAPVTSDSRVVHALQEVALALVLPGLIGSMAVSGIVLVSASWPAVVVNALALGPAAVINALLYFGIASAFLAISTRAATRH